MFTVKRLILMTKNIFKKSYILSIFSKLISTLIKDIGQLKQQQVTIVYKLYFKVLITLLYIIVFFVLYNPIGLVFVYLTGTVSTIYLPENPSLLYYLCFSYFWGTLAMVVNLWLLMQFEAPRELLISVIGRSDFNLYLGENPASTLKAFATKTYGVILVGSLASKATYDYLSAINAERRIQGIHKSVLLSRQHCPANDPIHTQPTMSQQQITDIYTIEAGSILGTLGKIFENVNIKNLPASSTNPNVPTMSPVLSDVLDKIKK